MLAMLWGARTGLVAACVALRCASASAFAPTCPRRAGPEKIVVVNAPTPYLSWEACNAQVNVGKGYTTESIDPTKHVGLTTL